MTTVPGFLQLLLLYLWIVPGNFTLINGINYLPDNVAVRVENISNPLAPFADITPSPPSPNATLPEGYTRFSGNSAAYKIHPERMSWFDARETCISEGARLAITDSQEKIIHIQSLPAYESHVWLYVGIRKPENTDDWVRVDDELPVPNSVPWAADFPDGVAGRRCAQISAFRNALVNYPCPLSESFVCEITISDDDNSEQSTTEVTITTSTAWSSSTEPHTDDDLKVSNDYDNDEFTHGGANSTTSPPPSPDATLPDGYVRFSKDHAAYKIHLEKKSWYEARDTCISEDAHLAIIDSQQKVNHIRSIRAYYRSEISLYVGIYKTENGDEWVRVDDGKPVSSIPWLPDFPEGGSGSCIVILVLSGLANYNCSSYRPFICEISITEVVDTTLVPTSTTSTHPEGYVTFPEENNETTTYKIDADDQSHDDYDADKTTYDGVVDMTSPEPPSPAASLPENYVRFPEDRAAYKIHQEKKSWYEARDTCISEGARLAITDSQEKIIHIQSLPANESHVWLYVGIHKPENADDWVRVDDELPVPSSVPWAADFPDGVAGRRCAQISGFRNALVNYPCPLSESFVCEITISDDGNSEQSNTEGILVAI